MAPIEISFGEVPCPELSEILGDSAGGMIAKLFSRANDRRGKSNAAHSSAAASKISCRVVAVAPICGHDVSTLDRAIYGAPSFVLTSTEGSARVLSVERVRRARLHVMTKKKRARRITYLAEVNRLRSR